MNSAAAALDGHKTCATCGRAFSWRKSWEANWDAVRYCSKGCRSRRPRELDHTLERTIVSLLEHRAAAASLCPSEAVRSVGGEDWRQLMERGRSAARRLVAEGLVVITQQGRVVDASTARGPIRVRLVRSRG
jgi:hypothetical protein